MIFANSSIELDQAVDEGGRSPFESEQAWELPP